jgi:hypothetical protein
MHCSENQVYVQCAETFLRVRSKSQVQVVTFTENTQEKGYEGTHMK